MTRGERDALWLSLWEDLTFDQWRPDYGVGLFFSPRGAK